MNQWQKLRNRSAGSNLVDMGRSAVRESFRRGRFNSEAVYACRWGDHAESLRRRRGDAVGVELDAQPGRSNFCERGNRSRPSLSPGTQPEEGQVRCRLMAGQWGGGSVVVRPRERREHGEGSQQICKEETGMPGGRR